MSQPDPNYDPLAATDKSPAMSFKDVPDGTVKTIDVSEPCRSVQQRDYDTELPSFWDPVTKGKKTTTPNDKPCMAAVFNGVDSDGEPISLWCPIPSDLMAKTKTAQDVLGRRIGADGNTDRIHVKITGRGVSSSGKGQKNLYAVKVEPLGKTPKPAESDPFADDPWGSAPAGEAPPF